MIAKSEENNEVDEGLLSETVYSILHIQAVLTIIGLMS